MSKTKTEQNRNLVSTIQLSIDLNVQTRQHQKN